MMFLGRSQHREWDVDQFAHHAQQFQFRRFEFLVVERDGEQGFDQTLLFR
jgi:hypothetical protein